MIFLFFMIDFENNFFVRRICDTLIRQNSEKWFKFMKQWFKNKTFWKIVDSNFISKFIETISIIDEIFIISHNNEYIWNNQLNFDSHNDINFKFDARTQYQFIHCINDDDQELMTKLEIFKKIWKTLINKYKKKLQIVEKQYIQKLINYKKSSNMIIETTYIDIIKKSRKVVALQSNMTDFAKFERRFQTFLTSLSFEYDVIRDAIDV